MGLTVEQKLAKAKIFATRQYPFFAILMLSCEYVVDPTCGTAWADGKRIGYDPKFIEALEPEEVAFVLAHEALHNAFLDIPRRGARDPMIWNMACDYWINDRLKSECEGRGNSNGGMRAPNLSQLTGGKGGELGGENGMLWDAKYSGMSKDAIYADLIKQRDQQRQQQQQGQGKPQKGGQGGPGDPGGNPNPGGMGGDLNYKQSKSQGNDHFENAKAIEEFWKDAAAKASAAAKMQGHMPAGFERDVTELLKPKIDYRSVLAQYISQCPVDYEFTNPDRRFLESYDEALGVNIPADFVLPDMDGHRLNVVLIADTSGSIGEAEMTQMLSESSAVLRSFDRVDGYFMDCDAEVHQFLKIGPEDPMPKRFKGGGGTSFKPPFARLKKESIRPDVAIYFTDGYGDFPEPKDAPFPVIWVMVNSDVLAPFGETIPITFSR